MTRARFRFWGGGKSDHWLKLINLSWLKCLDELYFEEIRNTLKEGEAELKSREYNIGELGVLSSTPHAQLMIFFDSDGKLDQAHLEFDLRYRLFNDVKELKSHPR